MDASQDELPSAASVAEAKGRAQKTSQAFFNPVGPTTCAPRSHGSNPQSPSPSFPHQPRLLPQDAAMEGDQGDNGGMRYELEPVRSTSPSPINRGEASEDTVEDQVALN